MMSLSARARQGAAASLGASLVLLSGCAVGPDFIKPAAPSVSGYAPVAIKQTTNGEGDGPSVAVQTFSDGRDVAADWWTDFGSPALNALVERALKNNPTIPAAQATLRQAQELVYAQQGYFFPAIGADYNIERQQLAGNLGGNSPGIQGNGKVVQTYQNPSGPPPFNGPAIYTMHTAQLTVGYTPDVFGGNRRQVESLEGQAEQQRDLLQATTVSLATNVVAAAIQEAATRDQIGGAQAIIAANRKTVELVRKEFASGYAMRMDLAAAESALAQAEQLLPPLEKQLEQTRDLLRALVGNLPDQEVETIPALSSLRLPRELPMSLPSNVIDQRPDVRAAEEQLRSAYANVGVAVAARLPQFSITGAAGGTATQFSQIFKDGGPFWNVIGDVAGPIFDGNTLLHRERAANQALRQAMAQYRGTVIAAYQNVADTLHAIASDADALVAAVRAERAAKITLDLTVRQRQAGQVNSLTLYVADMAYQQAMLSRVQAESQRFGDTAALYQAMGGGWWNRTDLAADDTPGDILLDPLK